MPLKGDSLCKSSSFPCIWDMGSAHKKTEHLHSQIDLLSTPSEMVSSHLFTIGFGGLHLAKAITNTMCNYILSYGGENFSINMLQACKGGSNRVPSYRKTGKVYNKNRHTMKKNR